MTRNLKPLSQRDVKLTPVLPSRSDAKLGAVAAACLMASTSQIALAQQQPPQAVSPASPESSAPPQTPSSSPSPLPQAANPASGAQPGKLPTLSVEATVAKPKAAPAAQAKASGGGGGQKTAAKAAEPAPTATSATEAAPAGGTQGGSTVAPGATAVLVGRPLMYALAVGGASCVSHALRILRDEFEAAMALTGCRTIGDIGAHLTARPGI